jgi:hypothetical protein
MSNLTSCDSPNTRRYLLQQGLRRWHFEFPLGERSFAVSTFTELHWAVAEVGVLSNRADWLNGTALDDLRRLAGSAQCALPHDTVFGLLGLLSQTISSKNTIDYKRDETELLLSVIERGGFYPQLPKNCR